MNGPSVGEDVFVNYIAGFSGTLLVCNISSLFSSVPKFVKEISRNTLFIIFFHWCCLCFVRKQLFYGDGLTIHLFECIIISIAILVANYIAIRVLLKCWPTLLGKYKK